MSTQKGRKNELECRRAYEAAGFWVYSPENASYGDNDLWNLFDLAAIDVRNRQLVFVQVKTNRGSGIRQWCNDTRPFDRVSGVVCHFAIKHDREGWQLKQPIRNGSGAYETVYDERKDDRVSSHRGTDMSLGDGLAAYLSGIDNEPTRTNAQVIDG